MDGWVGGWVGSFTSLETHSGSAFCDENHLGRVLWVKLQSGTGASFQDSVKGGEETHEAGFSGVLFGVFVAEPL